MLYLSIPLNKEFLILKEYIFNIDLSIAYLSDRLKNPIIETIYNYILEIWDFAVVKPR